MPESIDKNAFASIYSGQAPWDIGKPQKPFIDVADPITGSVLDAGCGTGDTTLYLASRGNKVTGIDFLEEPIKRANRKAAERGLAVTFLVKDALTLKDWSERFDNVIDSGLFHVFSERGPGALRQRAGNRPQAWRSPVPDVFQRRGTGRAEAETSVEEGTTRRLLRWLEGRVDHADSSRGRSEPQGFHVLRRRAEGVVRSGPTELIHGWEANRRLVPDEPFPPYAFVPDRLPHPTSDPAGHSFGKEPAVPANVDPERWHECRPYLIALAFPRAEFEALKQRLVAHGAILIEPERPTPFVRFFFRDPNGYVFKVVDAGREPES